MNKNVSTGSTAIVILCLLWAVVGWAVDPPAASLEKHETPDVKNPIKKNPRVFWHERHAKKSAWESTEEIAVFPKRGYAARINASALSAKFHETAEISESNDFVIFLRSKTSIDPAEIKKKITAITTMKEIAGASPVFYISGRKDPSTRMALTGEVIVRYPENAAQDQIHDLETEYALTQKTKIDLKANTFIYHTRDALDSLDIANGMQASGKVIYASPNWLRGRAKRSLPEDSLFPDQWHLYNTGQNGGTPGEDVNIISAWDQYRGSGNEIIAIVDDGLEINHEDLKDNVAAGLSWDYTQNDADPTAGDHGTCCAGVAAARGFNPIGVTGAGPNAGLVGYRILDSLTDVHEAGALTLHNDVVDIYSNSWGPDDSGQALEAPGPLTQDALETGATTGRKGLGSIFVWAGGNGYDYDNSNYDGYANSRYTIAVAASTNFGTRAYYSEKGANILINAPSNGGTLGITTTDRSGAAGFNKSGNYMDTFSGTSSATALVSGIIALILEANPGLSRRDVQHILMSTAEKNDPDDSGWSTNGAGYPVNHRYGYGRIDAGAAVVRARTWTPAAPERSVQAGSTPNLAIPDNDTTGVSDAITVNENLRVEFVEVIFTAQDHSYWGDLEITLTSPGGTQSILAEKHRSGSDTAYDHWKFGTVRHYGELANGGWTLRVKDLASVDTGTFQAWTLKIYGTDAETRGDINGDGLLNLKDAICVLQALTRTDLQNNAQTGGNASEDLSGDGRIGLEEAVYVLQRTAGIRGR